MIGLIEIVTVTDGRDIGSGDVVLPGQVCRVSESGGWARAVGATRSFFLRS